jgi:hypothetical protein
MTTIDISNALQTLTPGAQWVLHGSTLDGLTWLDTVQVQPTNDEIMAAIAAYVPPPSLEQQIATLQAQVATLLSK